MPDPADLHKATDRGYQWGEEIPIGLFWRRTDLQTLEEHSCLSRGRSSWGVVVSVADVARARTHRHCLRRRQERAKEADTEMSKYLDATPFRSPMNKTPRGR